MLSFLRSFTVLSPNAGDCNVRRDNNNKMAFAMHCNFMAVRRRSSRFGQGRINHSGAPYQRKVGALFSYA